MTYRIKNWEKIFENSASRQRGKLFWVPMPNHHDSGSFTALMDHHDGLAHYGCWALIVQVASKCHPRGTLLSGNCQPIDSRALARIVRGNHNMFEVAIKRLLAIGWLEVIADCQPTANALSADCQPTGIEEKEGKERKERKENKTAAQTAAPPGLPINLKQHEQIINDWFRYKLERREAYKPGALKALFTRMAAWGPRLPDKLQTAMANGWRGFDFEDKVGTGFKKPPPRSPTGPTPAELRAQAEIVEENKKHAERDRLQYERDLRDALPATKPNEHTAGGEMAREPKISNMQDMRDVVPRLKSVPKIG